MWKSSLTQANGSTITVTNDFYGDLIISKVVTGDQKSNIGVFEINVACDKGGPKDTFLLKDRQSKIYNNIAVGTNYLMTETRTDGAVASYSDNSGDNAIDGRVTIKARSAVCSGYATVSAGSLGTVPTPTTSYADCMANVIVTNDYNPPATTTTAARDDRRSCNDRCPRGHRRSRDADRGRGRRHLHALIKAQRSQRCEPLNRL